MASQLTRSAVRIYGALSALGNGSGNILDCLLPFLDPILRSKTGQKLDPGEIAKDIRDTYKWNFNADVVEAFVPHLERAGWVVADIPDSTNTTYTIQMPEEDTEEVQSDLRVEAELQDIARQFKEFSESLSPLTAIPREVEEFEDILVEWLLYVEAFSEKSLEFEAGVRPDAAGTLRHFVDVPEPTALRDEEKFLCARFVQHAISTNPSVSEVLARIAAIGLLTEVVQDFVKPVSSVEHTNLIVYLDAPVAMELLGVSGRAARENTEPVVSELIRIGATIRIFGQSIEEIKHSLGAVLKNPRPTGPTAQALMHQEVLKEYVIEASQNPEPLLEKHGVKVTYRTLEQTPSEHQYFSDEQRTALFGTLKYAENPYARDHDADIVTLVMRQRHGFSDPDIFESRFIVLTRNGLLAQLAQSICVDLGLITKGVVPPVVHRRVLAMSMWLRTGLGAGDLNIPKRMLLASCERVLAIRPGVVEAVKRMTDALGDEEKTRQLDLLISQDRSTQALMDKTLGLTNVVTADNLPVLFQEMLYPHLEKEREKGEAAVREAKAAGRLRLNEAQKKLRIAEQEQGEVAARLQTKLDEDEDAVSALCEEAGVALRRDKRLRMSGALALALVCWVPVVLQPSLLSVAVSLPISLGLGYLTLTGGRLVGTDISEKMAFNKLQTMASKRRLAGKLSQFEITWDGNEFTVDRPFAMDSDVPQELFDETVIIDED